MPTIFDTCNCVVEVDGQEVELELSDTAGIADYDHLRPRSYPDTHVCMICFSIDSPDSLKNVEDKVRILCWNRKLCSRTDNTIIVVHRGSPSQLRKPIHTRWSQERSPRRLPKYSRAAEILPEANNARTSLCSPTFRL